MATRDVGPPERERPGPTPETGPNHKSATTTDNPKNSVSPRLCGSQTRPWRRRREAAQRLVPLGCGCSDPLGCRCTFPPLSDRMVDAGADAARHVLGTGRVPLLELEVLRALWKRGGDDRVLAQELYDLAGGEIG